MPFTVLNYNLFDLFFFKFTRHWCNKLNKFFYHQNYDWHPKFNASSHQSIQARYLPRTGSSRTGARFWLEMEYCKNKINVFLLNSFKNEGSLGPEDFNPATYVVTGIGQKHFCPFPLPINGCECPPPKKKCVQVKYWPILALWAGTIAVAADIFDNLIVMISDQIFFLFS